VVYSHGLGGTNALYSTQATNLASYGYVVMMVEHTDGSAPLTKLQSGEILEHYKDIYKLRNDPEHPNTPWDTPIYVKGRRKQLLTRVEEVSEVAAWAKEAFLVRLDKEQRLERCDSKSFIPPSYIPPSYITNNHPLVASLHAAGIYHIAPPPPRVFPWQARRF